MIAGMTMTATIIGGLPKFHFYGWSVFRSVKKIAPCHATCSPLSLVRLSNKDRERPRARTRTGVLVTGDNILSYHFHSIPLFARFISPFCRSVSEDETSNKLCTNVVYVKDLTNETFSEQFRLRGAFNVRNFKLILQNDLLINEAESKPIRDSISKIEKYYSIIIRKDSREKI